MAKKFLPFYDPNKKESDSLPNLKGSGGRPKNITFLLINNISYNEFNVNSIVMMRHFVT